jgi:hypothetical protein
MILFNVASKSCTLLHLQLVSRWVVRITPTLCVQRIPQNCESLRFPPPILPSAMIDLESRRPGGAFDCSEDVHESRMSVRRRCP